MIPSTQMPQVGVVLLEKVGEGVLARFSNPYPIRSHNSHLWLLTLIMTKTCDFRYPIHDITKTSMPYYCYHIVALNIIDEGFLLMILSIMMKK